MGISTYWIRICVVYGLRHGWSVCVQHLPETVATLRRSDVAYGIGYCLQSRWLWRCHHLAHPCENGAHHTAKPISRQSCLPLNLAIGT